MRTTLRIADDVLTTARNLAKAEGRTVGQVISDLARKGLAHRQQEEMEMGFPVFSLPDNPTPITPEMVCRAAGES